MILSSHTEYYLTWLSHKLPQNILYIKFTVVADALGAVILKDGVLSSWTSQDRPLELEDDTDHVEPAHKI